MILKLEDEIGCEYMICVQVPAQNHSLITCVITLTTSCFMCVAMNCRMAQQPRGNCGRGWQNV